MKGKMFSVAKRRVDIVNEIFDFDNVIVRRSLLWPPVAPPVVYTASDCDLMDIDKLVCRGYDFWSV